MLAIYLFHYVREDDAPWSTSPATMELHLQWFSRHGQTVHTGETALPGKKAIMLSFDDASFCFYHYVYPLLKRYAMKAVLAVPTDFIPETVPDNPTFRLQPRVDLLLQQEAAPHPAFCSWRELHEMQSSGLVEIASHTRTHPNLNTTPYLKEECEGAAQVIEQRLNKRPRALVLPFGKGSPDVMRTAQASYSQTLRIGNAWNRSVNSSLLYRVPCDDVVAGTLPKPGSLLLWRNYFWNRLRVK